MRLSDAILLGSTAIKWRAGTLAGCALGMGLEACGRGRMKREMSAGYTLASENYPGLFLEWEWITRPDHYSLPCGCIAETEYVKRGVGASFVIAHIFDNHVIHDQAWTLERLVDWVRSVEPSEAATQPSDGRAGTPESVPTERAVTDPKQFRGDCIDSLISSVERAEKA